MTVRAFFGDLFYMRNILIVIFTPLVLLPLLVVVGSSEAKCAYCVAIMAIFWVTEALPIAVTALLPVFLFPMVGLLSVKETSKEYINDTNMLFIGGLIVAAAIEHWDIHKRIALKVLMMVGSEPRWLMLGLMGPTWFLSMWISNTATTAMMIPIANAILLQLKENDDRYKSDFNGNDNKGLELNDAEFFDSLEVDVVNGKPQTEKKVPQSIENGDTHKEYNSQDEKLDVDQTSESLSTTTDNPAFLRLSKAVSLCIAYAANCGGIGSLTGTGPNLVFKGQLELEYEKYGVESPVTFARWLGFGVPTSLVLVVIVWVWLQIMFIRCGECVGAKDKERDRKVKEVIRVEYNKLGKITFGQAAVLGHFILLAILWVTRDFGGEYGWGHLFKKSYDHTIMIILIVTLRVSFRLALALRYIKDGVPAILIACLLFVFPSRMPQVFCRRPFGRRQPLKPLMSWQDAALKVPWGVVFLLGGGFAMANASKVSGLSAWIGDKLSVLDYLEPWVLNLVLCYIVAAMTEVTSNTATCTLMMPILANLAINLKQNPMYIMFPTAIATSFAFMLPVATPPNAVVFSYGYVRVVDMVKAGFILNVICVWILIASTETLGQALFNLHTIPPEILVSFNKTH